MKENDVVIKRYLKAIIISSTNSSGVYDMEDHARDADFVPRLGLMPEEDAKTFRSSALMDYLDGMTNKFFRDHFEYFATADKKTRRLALNTNGMTTK